MGETVGGDQDDWTLSALGIPSVTSEVGYVGQFKNDGWNIVDSQTAKDLMNEQGAWMDYIYAHLGEFGKIVDKEREMKKQEAKKPKKTILG